MKLSVTALLLLAGSISAWGQQNPLSKNVSKGDFPKGLSGRHIAVWHSHGFYYEPKLDRWEWQRARCFSNAEDIGNMPYVVTYLTPMLENAGAVVLNPRERDIQRNMFVVDPDGSSAKSCRTKRKGSWKKKEGGYKHLSVLYNYDNPFKKGSYLQAKASEKGKAELAFVPNMPNDKRGDYAVYVSWANTPDNVSDVTYKVYHTGGVTEFKVNQKMFGATWNYLGTFNFDKKHGKVTVSNKSSQKGVVTVDAVRFGGGMGLVARRPSAKISDNVKSNDTAKPQQESVNPDDFSWKLSGVPSYLEGARYYLQFAGIPDSIYSTSKYQNDYNDDYRSRPHWVNYVKKQGVPLDLSLAFHTDAGTTPNDSIIGTLAIYSTHGDSLFTDGRSKMLNHDFGQIIQDQICNDIKAQCNTKWRQRDLRNGSYSEATIQDVPSMLLELLSHQNLADMTYHLDPRFRFIVSRAIYKAMTRFLNGADAVIQPLAPNSFAIEKLSGRKVRLTWQNTTDSLEATADAKSYRIYMKTEDNGYSTDFIAASGNNAEVELPEWGKRYSFKVTGVNEGGESFPSEELSACLFENSEAPALLVNGFTRISAPSHFDNGDMAGFNWWEDEGVTEGYDMAFLGYQQDFLRSHPWLDDDNTGWGSSDIDGWGKVVRGNTHDFTGLHGKSYQTLGVSYVSASRSAFESMPLQKYSFIDVMFGEQRAVKNFREDRDSSNFAVYSPAILSKLDTALQQKTPLLISGSYVGTDMVESNDSTAIAFASQKLGYRWMTNHASKLGEVYSVDKASSKISGHWTYASTLDDIDRNGKPMMKIESPDGIEPENGAQRILRYTGINVSAGTLLDKDGTKVVVLGFPVESILDEGNKAKLIEQIVKFFRLK